MNEAAIPEPVQEIEIEPSRTIKNPTNPAYLGLNAAVRLTGASRNTILKYAEEGRLSYELNAIGKKVYQVAELQRVFPNMRVQNGSQKNELNHVEPEELAENTVHKLELLEQENRFLKEKLQAEAEKASREAQNAEDWKEQCRRLTLMLPRPEPEKQVITPQPEPQPTPEPQKGFLSRLFGGGK